MNRPKQASSVKVPDHRAYHAQVEGDQIVYAGRPTSPSTWRAAEAVKPRRPGVERRRKSRRRTD